MYEHRNRRTICIQGEGSPPGNVRSVLSSVVSDPMVGRSAGVTNICLETLLIVVTDCASSCPIFFLFLQSTSMIFFQYRMMHDFIRKENKLHNTTSTHEKHGRENNTQKAKRGFQNKQATYWPGSYITYSDSTIHPNETEHYNIHHSRPVLLSRPALSAFTRSQLRTSSSTFFNHSIYC